MVAGGGGRLLPHETRRFAKEYDLCSLIGKGSFGEVWVCQEKGSGGVATAPQHPHPTATQHPTGGHQDSGGQHAPGGPQHLMGGRRLAAKLIDKGSLRTTAEREDVQREVAILEAFAGRHEGVVQLREALEGDSLVHLVMELCEGGDLFELLRAKGSLPEEGAKLMFRQLAATLAFCHSHGVVHRDIKPENILLDACGYGLYQLHSPSEDPPLVRTKLADFGLAAVLGPDGMTAGYTGSRYYTAPEMLKGWMYGRGADVWSLGVVLCTMLTGRLPFAGQNKQDVHGLRQSILKGKVNFDQPSWERVSGPAKDLVRRMLTVDPQARITAQDALHHPWLAWAEGEPLPTERDPLLSHLPGYATRSLPRSPADHHQQLQCQRPYASAGAEKISEFRLCDPEAPATPPAAAAAAAAAAAGKTPPMQLPAQVAFSGKQRGKHGAVGERAGGGWGEQRGGVVAQGSSSGARGEGMCCISPLALSDFGSVGVWCFPQLLGRGWLDDPEEEAGAGGPKDAGGGGAEKGGLVPAAKARTPIVLAPPPALLPRPEFAFRLGEPHKCVAPLREFYVN